MQSAFHFHYARLIEIIFCIERMELLLNDPAILDRHVRAHAGVNALEGIGVAEAPRGTLIHHYKVNEDGAITWATSSSRPATTTWRSVAASIRSAATMSMATGSRTGCSIGCRPCCVHTIPA